MEVFSDFANRAGVAHQSSPAGSRSTGGADAPPAKSRPSPFHRLGQLVRDCLPVYSRGQQDAPAAAETDLVEWVPPAPWVPAGVIHQRTAQRLQRGGMAITAAGVAEVERALMIEMMPLSHGRRVAMHGASLSPRNCPDLTGPLSRGAR